MDNRRDFRVLVRSRYPLILAQEGDEDRFLRLARLAAQENSLPLWTWSRVRGLMRDGEPTGQYQTEDPKQAFAFIKALGVPGGLFIFLDVQEHLDDAVFVRTVKEAAQRADTGTTIVLAVQQATMPPELAGLAIVWELEPPSEQELGDLVQRTIQDLTARSIPVTLTPDEQAQLVRSIKGLSAREAAQIINEAAMHDGHLAGADLAFVHAAKASLVETDGVLEMYEPSNGTLDAVGGMQPLKDWLISRGRAFEPKAQAFGLEPPRGVLVTGVPGCGKSLIAKTLAATWRLPLILLDPARLYGSYVGQSEQRLAAALRTVEAMTPCVLWIDEIEKGFASSDTGDGGVSSRIRGTFLRWLQERPAGVFVVATCNQVQAMPPEFLRKGRFDEIFFVDLPDKDERDQIFRLHLTKRKRDPATFDLGALVDASDGFTGAEIEAAVVGALYRAYEANQELSTQAVLAELEGTVPLSRTRAEEIAALRAWAKGRAVPANR